MAEPEFLDIEGAAIAYRRMPGRAPGIVWLGGYRSDMMGTKAETLAGWAAANGRAFLRFDYGLLAYGLAVSTLFVALGALALDRGGPGLLTAFLPWGLIGLILSLNVELVRILDADEARPGTAHWLNYFAYALALPAVVGLGLLTRERRFAWPLAVALFMSLLVPVLFWSGGAVSMAGKIVVAALILSIAIGVVVAGAGGGVRRLSIAGSLLFAIAVVTLLWQTIGTLLDQSLFFLVGGAALIAIASGMRRLLAKVSKPVEAAP